MCRDMQGLRRAPRRFRRLPDPAAITARRRHPRRGASTTGQAGPGPIRTAARPVGSPTGHAGGAVPAARASESVVRRSSAARHSAAVFAHDGHINCRPPNAGCPRRKPSALACIRSEGRDQTGTVTTTRVLARAKCVRERARVRRAAWCRQPLRLAPAGSPAGARGHSGGSQVHGIEERFVGGRPQSRLKIPWHENDSFSTGGSRRAVRPA